MAAAKEVINYWSSPPEDDIRRSRSIVEDELLIKLGAKKEMIEFHPLILSSRPKRPQSPAKVSYTRVSPTVTERYPLRNSWTCGNPALRQLSNPCRRGPRDSILPNLVKPYESPKTYIVQTRDEEYFQRRSEIMKHLDLILGEWTAYHKRAFPTPLTRSTSKFDLHRQRKLSGGSIAHLSIGTGSRRRSSVNIQDLASIDKPSDSTVPLRDTNRRNKFKDMANETLLHIKASQMKLPADLPKSELRIYMSSTPDLKEEREFLEEVAYPKLRDLCEKLGLNCYVVDMRSGSGQLFNDIETFDLIEMELRNCRRLSMGPCFVSLIGHEMDDDRLPGFFPKEVYEQIREIFIREELSWVEVFDDIYRLDSNRVPPVYVKQPLVVTGQYESVETIEANLLEVLTKAVEIIRNSGEGELQEATDFYKWSVIVREVEEGLLDGYSPRSNTLCFMMEAEKENKELSPVTCIDRLRQNIQQHYRHYASKDNLVSFKSGKKSMSYLRSLSDTFISNIASILKQQIRQRDYDVTHQLTNGSEVIQHVRMACAETNNSCSDSTELLDNLVKELKPVTEKPKIVVVLGKNGLGKTASAAMIAKESTSWQPKRKVVFRCLGMTLRSSSLFRVIESLINQLCFLYSLDVIFPTNLTIQEAVNLFCKSLHLVAEKAESRGQLFLILDQLDQLNDINAQLLTNILDSIETGVSLLITIRESHELVMALQAHSKVTFFTIVPLQLNQIENFVTKNLEKVNRRLTSDQLDVIRQAQNSIILPAHAQIVFHISRWWPSSSLPELKQFTDNLDADFKLFIETLESSLGESFTRYALSLLSATRYGLADYELLHLLSKNSNLLDEIKKEKSVVSVVEGYPYQHQLSRLISRLNRLVVEVKVEGESVLVISSRAFSESIQTMYLQGDFKQIIHQQLANFFMFIRRGMLLSSKDISEKRYKELSRYHWRTLRCVPYHLCYSHEKTSEVWKDLKQNVFFNFTWLINAVYSGFFYDLIEDITYALENVSLHSDAQYLQLLLLSVRKTIIQNPLSLAAIFSSQNTNETLTTGKESVEDIVKDARIFLQQVHIQALIPVTYTSDKVVRLLIKSNSIKNATLVFLIGNSGSVCIQRNQSLFILDLLTREEFPIFSTDSTVVFVRVSTDKVIGVVTKNSDDKYWLNTVSLEKGNGCKSIWLSDSTVTWFDLRSSTTAYFWNTSGLRSVNLKTENTTTVLVAKQSWSKAFISYTNVEKIITMIENDNTIIEIRQVKDVISREAITFRKEQPNTFCEPILTTKDGKYVVFISERQGTLISCIYYKVLSIFSHNGLPIVKAVLSRSHEHLFLGYANGIVTCHVLHSGNESMLTKIHSLHKTDKSDANNVETFTCMITSEDDHFLICGTNNGYVYIFHVPTGYQIVSIRTGNISTKHLSFLTDPVHFQHLISIDDEDTCLHWNLRPLFRQSRILLEPYIIDEDLSKEETVKLDIAEYYPTYSRLTHDRTFLNGPDIAAFYNHPPEDLFLPLVNLDPAFGILKDWEESESISECSKTMATFTCSVQLSDALFTMTEDKRLAKWSLHTGKLIWVKKMNHLESQVLFMQSVYFDQAVLFVEESHASKIKISLVYITEEHHSMFSRDHIISYQVSADMTYVLVLCENQSDSSNEFYLWDLVNNTEQSYPHSFERIEAAAETVYMRTFSGNVNQCIELFTDSRHKNNTDELKKGQNSDNSNIKSDRDISSQKLQRLVKDKKNKKPRHTTLQLLKLPLGNKRSPNIELGRTSSRRSSKKVGFGTERSESTTSQKSSNSTSSLEDAIDNTDPNENSSSTVELITEQLFPGTITCICFFGENHIFVGLYTGHILLLSLPSLKLMSVLGESGPNLVVAPDVDEDMWTSTTTPHGEQLQRLTMTLDEQTLVSISRCVLCLWEIHNMSLRLTVSLESNEQITGFDISKDATVVAVVVNKNIIKLFTTIEKPREIATFMTIFTIFELAMSADCQKIVVLGTDQRQDTVFEIFNVKNIDDILMKVPSRRKSQQLERSESLLSERKKKTSRTMSTKRRSTFNILDSDQEPVK